MPLSAPGLFAGALMVFVLCLGFFVTPAVLGGGAATFSVPKPGVSMSVTSQVAAER